MSALFSGEQTGKKQQAFGVGKIASYKKHYEGEKSLQRKSFFDMLELTKANNSGFLIL